MTRVSENSSTASLQFAMKQAKGKLEDLQLKGSTLKKITKPSDNPMASIESLTITSNRSDTKQYLNNCSHAALHLESAEKAIEQLSDIIVKAKEIAISQSSGFYNEDVRKNIATEVEQLYNHSIALANKRVGQRYIFSGLDTLKPPFDAKGVYTGDTGKITLEISKDFFIPINLNGKEIFYTSESVLSNIPDPLTELREKGIDVISQPEVEGEEMSLLEGRGPASLKINAKQEEYHTNESIFGQLNTLVVALKNNDNKSVQSLLEGFDTSLTKLITLRTRLGSLMQSVETARNNLESEDVTMATRKSHLVDADIAELFSDLTKQQEVLKTTYKSGSTLMNKNLLEFIR